MTILGFNAELFGREPAVTFRPSARLDAPAKRARGYQKAVALPAVNRSWLAGGLIAAGIVILLVAGCKLAEIAILGRAL